MFHFCIFGGHGGQLSPDKRFYVTICGGCEVKRPTLARQLIDKQRRGQLGSPGQSHYFITICGGTEVKAPTLAEEYLDLRDALQAGALTLAQWDSVMAQLAVQPAMRIESFTLCGGFDSDALPGESEEIEGLALNRHAGQIPDAAGQVLELGVGQAGAARTALIRQAVAESLA